MEIAIYQVDAFTSQVFGGNPAAICFLDAWLDAEIMQKIATENNLSETAFLVKDGEDYQIRWFTPEVEIDLCGHATLASAYILFSRLEPSRERVSFKTMSGVLTVQRTGSTLTMDFPTRRPVRVTDYKMDILIQALGVEPKEIWKSRDLMLVYDREEQVREMAPDFNLLGRIKDVFGVIVTAPGNSADFVSRYFSPGSGIPEDPVTGSSHCNLIPYWAEKLGKEKFHAMQLSKRGGELFCEQVGERVRISGYAALYMVGTINI